MAILQKKKLRIRRGEVYDLIETDDIHAEASDLPELGYQKIAHDTVGFVHEPNRKIVVQRQSKKKKESTAFHEVCHVALGRRYPEREILYIERNLHSILYANGLRFFDK